MKELFDLFLTFCRIGGLTFGGGYAMMPMLQRECVEKKGWVTENELMDYYSVGQCTPGVIAVNTATFVGNKVHGVLGGIFASLGVVFPSLVIICIIAAVLQAFAHYPAVQNAFAGIRVGVCVLILNSIIKLFKKAIIDKWTLGIFIVVFLCALFIDITPIVFVVAAGIAGVLISNWKEKKTK